MFRIPLIKPYLPPSTYDAVNAVLESGHLTEGAVVRKLEEQAADFIGCRSAIAVTSCTSGLEAALRALGIGAGDEVIVPDYTYPATATACALVGATAVLVDVDRHTMLLDYDRAEHHITDKTKALMPVSEFGNPLDHDRLARIKQNHNVAIIEDAACALGSEYRGEKTGALADISVFSLHPRKFITSGEGGLLTTADDDIASWIRSYKHFGASRAPERNTVEFALTGTNDKMSDILGAVALEQMKMAEVLLERRRALAQRYLNMLSGLPGVEIPRTTDGGRHSYQTMSVLVDRRDEIMIRMRAAGIEAQIGTYALHHHPAFQTAAYRIPETPHNSDVAFTRCLALPLYHEMTEQDQDDVVRSLESCLTA